MDTLVIASHGFLASATAISSPNPEGPIAVTVNELRRLLHVLILEPARRVPDVIA